MKKPNLNKLIKRDILHRFYTLKKISNDTGEVSDVSLEEELLYMYDSYNSKFKNSDYYYEYDSTFSNVYSFDFIVNWEWLKNLMAFNKDRYTEIRFDYNDSDGYQSFIRIVGFREENDSEYNERIAKEKQDYDKYLAEKEKEKEYKEKKKAEKAKLLSILTDEQKEVLGIK